jgi:hypothetical protein
MAHNAAAYDPALDPYEVVGLLQFGSEPQRSFAAEALASMSRDDEDARVGIIATPGAAQALVRCLKSTPVERPATLAAVHATWHLSRSARCRGPLHNAGILPVLIRLVRGAGAEHPVGLCTSYNPQALDRCRCLVW